MDTAEKALEFLQCEKKKSYNKSEMNLNDAGLDNLDLFVRCWEL